MPYKSDDSMKKLIISVMFAATLSACGQVHTGGAGQLSDGKPVSGTVTRDFAKNEYTFSIMSPDGWSCSGKRGPSATPTAVVEIPLACSNGASGRMLLTMNQFKDQAVGTFSLSSGATGSVTFGQT